MPPPAAALPRTPAADQATQTDPPPEQPPAQPIAEPPAIDDADAPAVANVSGRVTQRAVTRVKQAVLTDLEDGAPHDGGKKLLERLPPRVVEMLPMALLAGGADEGVSKAIIQSIQSIDSLLFAVEEDKRRLLDAVRTLNVRATHMS